MRISPDNLAIFTVRARGRFADEMLETWRALAPKAWPKLVSKVEEPVLRSWAANVFDGCNRHQVRERALGVRLALATFRGAHLGLSDDYIESIIDYFIRSEHAHESALTWIEHVLDQPQRYARD